VAKAEEAGLEPGGPVLSEAEWATPVRGWFPELIDARARNATHPVIDVHRERIKAMMETNTVSTIHQCLRDEHGLSVGITSLRRYIWAEFPDVVNADKVTESSWELCRPEPPQFPGRFTSRLRIPALLTKMSTGPSRCLNSCKADSSVMSPFSSDSPATSTRMRLPRNCGHGPKRLAACGPTLTRSGWG
jgi:hypothetical protein